jgi:hypothetical protein
MQTIEEMANEWLNEAFLDPLKGLGFEFKGYAHVWDEEDSNGTHILKFEEEVSDKPSIVMDERRGDWESMAQICTQDDDSQPPATFRYYLGKLWVYIPYTI